MLEHTDAQIGRVIDYLEKIGQLDNTVIVFLSDNGASPEGGPEGRLNMNQACNIKSLSDTTEEMEEKLDLIGTDHSLNHYPVGWANLGNTPFQWYKTWVHSGGVKDPLIIHYPNGIQDKGGIREQYHHVIDITPTVLDIIGIEKPEIIRGVPQKPIQGKSIRYTFDAPGAESTRRVQYYEMLGNRGIYKDGWKAVVNHTFNDSFDEDVWELYHVAEDYSERNNVADQYPEKLRELQEEFYIEGGKYGVFPQHMNSHVSGPDAIRKLMGDRIIPEQISEYQHIYRFFDVVNEPNTENNSFMLTARIYRNSENEDGVIYSSGDRFGGWTLYVKENQLRYTVNIDGKYQHHLHADTALPVGRVTVKLSVRVEGDKSAVIQLEIDGTKAGEIRIENYSNKAGISYHTIGANRYVSVSDEYQSPFIFKGSIEHVKIRTAQSKTTAQQQLDKFFAID